MPVEINPFHLLIVDDEEAITAMLGPLLRRAGFVVEIASDGLEALEKVVAHEIDFIILDIHMPRMNGWAVLDHLRQAENNVPILMITSAIGDDFPPIVKGVDGFLKKPFEPDTLMGRIVGIGRRAPNAPLPLTHAENLYCGDLHFNCSEQKAFLRGRPVKLSRKATVLLYYLITHPNQVMTRKHLFNELWGWEHPVGTPIVDARIDEINDALNSNPNQYIETLRGYGYKFVAPVKGEK